MSRPTRYETYTQEMRRTVQQLLCDVCGTLVDVAPLKRPEGWVCLVMATDSGTETYDMCSFACLYGFVTDAGDEGPNSLLATLNASLAAERAKRGMEHGRV